mmetsp:Transcript_35099/g.78132  ORF Transcript_35099/g.78132 Transcript_35099/m.78132 type:complete len:331 (+) Transcript_35099:74-1066(+)|eukprot:CAMPEP_0202909142 /NCGR_PEP_ID=MMETSP1392-20130828/48436_1 /ASSEMBLY_ACC=CAM_ASM_000868 /TAXON_ID=225041 /ORGANISM="Chlamydomonas chlamydogama, Strain SAG 11-48b" /LENGTH=330 /DNA_ID=CAMNT_0049598791 /DNA_START=54 /DNA_END=1046 /DNA_ORIENTATION=+
MDVNLTDEHELQVQSYLRFAKLKRDQHVREVLSVISDFKNERLTRGEMYNYQDLVNMFGEMSDETRALVDKEIQHAYHTNALLVKILLYQAQVNGLELHVDTNQLENEFLLKTIASSERTALTRPATDFVRRNAQLSKIGTVATVGYEDPKMKKEREQLASDVQTMEGRMRALQEQTTQMMRERTNLNNEINSLRDQLAEKDAQLQAAAKGQNAMLSKLQSDFANLSTQAAGAANVSNSQFEELKHKLHETRGTLEQTRTDLARAQDELRMREQELRQTRDVLDGRLMESKQFQQMKQMMQKKSAEATELRKRLARYEPQSVPSADNDDY